MKFMSLPFENCCRERKMPLKMIIYFTIDLFRSRFWEEISLKKSATLENFLFRYALSISAKMFFFCIHKKGKLSPKLKFIAFRYEEWWFEKAMRESIPSFLHFKIKQFEREGSNNESFNQRTFGCIFLFNSELRLILDYFFWVNKRERANNAVLIK